MRSHGGQKIVHILSVESKDIPTQDSMPTKNILQEWRGDQDSQMKEDEKNLSPADLP